MLVGYESTARPLANAAYILTTKPDIQRKLQEEIDEISSKFNYDSVHNMVSLDWFIREILRMYPVAPTVMQ